MTISVAILTAGGLFYCGFLCGYWRRGRVERPQPPKGTMHDATLIAYWRKLAELRGER